jgi:hypothetical protein
MKHTAVSPANNIIGAISNNGIYITRKQTLFLIIVNEFFASGIK